MKQKKLYLLLRIVKTKRSINALLRENLTFKEIGDLTEQAINMNFIKRIDNEIVLTESGELTFEMLRKQFTKTNKDEWIEKEKDSQVEPHEKDFIFLPDPKELSFD